jgi:hypothetical protein
MREWLTGGPRDHIELRRPDPGRQFSYNVCVDYVECVSNQIEGRRTGRRQPRRVESYPGRRRTASGLTNRDDVEDFSVTRRLNLRLYDGGRH